MKKLCVLTLAFVLLAIVGVGCNDSSSSKNSNIISLSPDQPEPIVLSGQKNVRIADLELKSGHSVNHLLITSSDEAATSIEYIKLLDRNTGKILGESAWYRGSGTPLEIPGEIEGPAQLALLVDAERFGHFVSGITKLSIAAENNAALETQVEFAAVYISAEKSGNYIRVKNDGEEASYVSELSFFVGVALDGTYVELYTGEVFLGFCLVQQGSVNFDWLWEEVPPGQSQLFQIKTEAVCLGDESEAMLPAILTSGSIINAAGDKADIQNTPLAVNLVAN